MRAVGPPYPRPARLLVGLVVAALALGASGCGSDERPPTGRPNILFLMTDDHTVRAMSCYGSRINQTPHLDRLARGGVRFTQAFCTNAICAPSRATMLTGKYSHENGLLVNDTAFDGSQVTFPKLLQTAGYQTALVGKWHLGSDPTGFDYWNVLPGQGHYYNPDFKRQGETVRVSGYVTDLITDDALRWLESLDRQKPFCLLLQYKAPHRNWMPPPRHLRLFEDEDIPLPENYFDDYDSRGDAARLQEMSVSEHMYDAYDLKLAPPPPPTEAEGGKLKQDRAWWQAELDRFTSEQKAAWEAVYGPRNARFWTDPPKGRALALWKYQRYIKDYLRCVTTVDENIGRVLDHLDRSGLTEDTLVVYTSDQGFFLGEHGWYDKRFMYREAHGIPLLVRYPRGVPARVDDEHMVLNLDFAPTFLDYAGVEVPPEMQGRTLRPVLRGDAPGDWRQSVYYHYFEYPAIHAVRRHYGIRTRQHLLVHFYYDIDQWELYDVPRDPREMQNVYDDPAYADVRRRLEAELTRLRDRYGDTDESKHMPRAGAFREHRALGCPVVPRHPYASKYAAGGPGGLTDGKLGPGRSLLPDYTRWQGFEEVDLDAVIDLGETIRIERISAGFLQHVRDWIFLPRTVSFSVSEDGTTFRELGVVPHDVPQRESGWFRREIVWEPEEGPVRGRYLRVHAVSVGSCPEWHPGAGSKAWIFADEITVE